MAVFRECYRPSPSLSLYPAFFDSLRELRVCMMSDQLNITATMSDKSDEIEYINGVVDSDIIQLVELDRKVYGKDGQIPCSIIKSWNTKNPRLYCAAREKQTNKIIAYMGIFPLTEKLFRETLDPNFIENSIRSRDIEVYDKPGTFYLYINSIVVSPDYQRASFVYRKLFDRYIDFLLELVGRDIFFFELSARTVSPEGAKICRFLNMDRLTDESSQVQIFYTRLLPPSLRLITRNGKKLFQVYRDKYSEIA